MSIFSEALQAGRDVLRITFVEPLQHGRPRPETWPRSLRTVAWVSGIAFAALTVLVLASAPLRRYDVLVANPTSGETLPSLAVPIIIATVILALALAITAALHAPWWLRLGLLVIVAITVPFFGLGTTGSPLGLALEGLGVLVLAAFIAVRSFRGPAGWEFPAVLALVLITFIAPWAVPGAYNFGVDLRLAAAEGAFSSLILLVLPAAAVAGFAPAQIVVTAAQSIANRRVSRSLFWTIFALASAGLVVFVVFQVNADQPPTWPGIAFGAAELLLVAAAFAVMLRRAKAHRPPPPAAFPEAWSPWIYPIAATLASVVLIAFVLIIIGALAALVLPAEFSSAFTAARLAITSRGGTMAWYGLVAAAALIGGWQLARGGRLTAAIMLGTFGVFGITQAITRLPAFALIPVGTAAEMGLVAAAVALVTALGQLVRRRFDRGRATGVMTVLLLTVLYPMRDVVSDPLTSALAIAPTAMLIFGLAWRVTTEAEVTNATSERYPQATRVYLYAANALLAATGLAYVTLARGMGTLADTSQWSVVGDLLLGQPLYLAGLVSGLWLMLRPHAPGEVVVDVNDLP